jgi:hypothetical protein
MNSTQKGRSYSEWQHWFQVMNPSFTGGSEVAVQLPLPFPPKKVDLKLDTAR